MKIEYEISFVDALVIIDPERFKEMDEEFLYAFDIFLDKEGESELVCDFPGEDWKEVWDRETAVVQDFIEKSKMIVWRTEEGDYSSNIDKVNGLLEGGDILEIANNQVMFVSASELIQCLLYSDLDMEVIAEIALEKGTYCFKKVGDDIHYCKQ